MNNVYNVPKSVEAQTYFYQKEKVDEYTAQLTEKIRESAETSLVKDQNSRLNVLERLPSNEEFQNALSSGEANITQSFTQEPAVFTLFKLPDGITYAEVRDLDTGDVKYYPALDFYSYEDSSNISQITAKTGTLLEKNA